MIVPPIDEATKKKLESQPWLSIMVDRVTNMVQKSILNGISIPSADYSEILNRYNKNPAFQDDTSKLSLSYQLPFMLIIQKYMVEYPYSDY